MKKNLDEIMKEGFERVSVSTDFVSDVRVDFYENKKTGMCISYDMIDDKIIAKYKKSGEKEYATQTKP